MFRLSSRDFMFSARNLVFASSKFRTRSPELSIQFRYFKNRKHLALVDLVAYIYIDVADIAGHFGMNVDDLIGLKLPSQIQLAHNRASRDRDHCG